MLFHPFVLNQKSTAEQCKVTILEKSATQNTIRTMTLTKQSKICVYSEITFSLKTFLIALYNNALLYHHVLFFFLFISHLHLIYHTFVVCLPSLGYKLYALELLLGCTLLHIHNLEMFSAIWYALNKSLLQLWNASLSIIYFCLSAIFLILIMMGS